MTQQLHEKQALPFVITFELYLDDFLHDLFKSPAKPVSRLTRIKLFLRGVLGQLIYFEFKDDGVTIKGWVSRDLQEVFVTSVDY